MNLLFLDFETQSDDPTTTNATEVGASMFLFDGEKHHQRERLSQLIYDPSYPPQTEQIVDLTGITDEMLQMDGKAPLHVFTHLCAMVAEADYVLAHNKTFDQGVYESVGSRLIPALPQPKKGWICTIQDVPYDKKYKCKKLAHLCYDHKIIVHPDTLHRAINDVDLMAQLITTQYDFHKILKYWETPWVCLFLNGVKGPWEDNGVSNKMAKKLGYSWETPWGTDLKFPKRWVKRLKEDQLQEEKARTPAPFTLSRQT